MFERFTESARRTVVQAQAESRELGHSYLGNEHLVLALSVGDGPAAQALASLGLTHEKLRASLLEILGTPDADALAAIGIDLEEVRRRVEASFGPGALERGHSRPRRWGGEKCVTPRAKKAMELALKEAIRRGDRHIGAEHLLLGIVRVGEGVGVELLERCGAPPARVRETLEALISPAASRRARGA